MIWKQKLANLKKDLKEAGDLKSKSPAPKTNAKPEKPIDIQEEDALFLQAMGRKPSKTLSVLDNPGEQNLLESKTVKLGEPVSSDQESGTFHSSMQSLKGLKPRDAKKLEEIATKAERMSQENEISKRHCPDFTLTTGGGKNEEKESEANRRPSLFLQTDGCELVEPDVIRKPEKNISLMDAEVASETQARHEEPLASGAQGEKEASKRKENEEGIAGTSQKLKEEVRRQQPTLIHLAAGMAVDVDGTLDLRGHSHVDALERLRERIQDGLFLGWRTFHVTLGSSDELRTAFLNYIQSEEASVLTRYAQAPIPMGGAQAWILYYPSH